MDTKTKQETPWCPPTLKPFERDFTATQANQKWLSDLTFLPTTEGWL